MNSFIEKRKNAIIERKKTYKELLEKEHADRNSKSGSRGLTERTRKENVDK